ncbi:peptidoglycan-binding protein [Silanimonas sp.]|uniref:peptidoglycan-binding protein n=1 Tax=Silanimonas sp. TaxID=1929290 RepID=UPI0031BA6BFC
MDRDYSRQDVLGIVERTAAQRGIPRDDFLRFAFIETGGQFNERAFNPSSGAAGLFQFVPGTAREYGIRGREFDPVANADAGARLYLANRADIVASHERSGRPFLSGEAQPNGLDLYLAHQQGAYGYRSIQAAIDTGRFFSDTPTRANLLANVGGDLEAVTGVSRDRFRQMGDRELAQTFVNYWDTKYDRIRIPEVGIEPRNGAAMPTPPGRAPSAPSTPMADGVLREGERGAEVRQLQERLNAVGARDAAGRVLGTDGQFGQRTEDAVRSFQRARGLEVDGLAGPETLRALDAAVRARAASPMADGVLREGERGVEVRQLQERLNAVGARDAAGRVLGTDGQFGQRTEDAVRNFQRARGLEVDGIAGPETLRALQQPAPTRPTPGAPSAPEPTPPAGLRSGWPVPGRTEINVADKRGEGGGEFGEARSGGREHKGIDINGRVGDRIEAFAPGRVVFTGQMRGFGNTVIIQHDGGVQTVYAHLDRITVRDQQQVDRSTPIATMGRSGNTPSTGDTHLHFEIREGANGTPLSGRAVDPRRYLHFEGETSQRVGEIQQHLQRLDIRDGRGQPIRADMGYGDRTREAVESFQRSRGIEVTGIVDPSTLDALRRAQPQPRLEPRADVAPMDVRSAALAHPMVRQADAALQREQPGLPADQRLAIAASLADQGTRRGLTEITSVAAGPNGSWFAIQGDVRREDFQQASVTREQIAQPLEKPLASLAEQDRQRAATAAAELPNLPRERSPHLT